MSELAKHEVPYEKFSEFVYWAGTDLLDYVNREMYSAISKHSWERTPLNTEMSNHVFLSVLTEEVGEVAHAINYDSEDLHNLKDELTQVITMASARLYALEQLLNA